MLPGSSPDWAKISRRWSSCHGRGSDGVAAVGVIWGPVASGSDDGVATGATSLAEGLASGLGAAVWVLVGFGVGVGVGVGAGASTVTAHRFVYESVSLLV